MSDGSLAVVSIIPESELGVLAGPKQTLRYTSTDLTTNVTSVENDEVDGRRQSLDHIRTDVDSSGNINGRISYGTYDYMWEMLFCQNWTGNVLTPGTDIISAAFEKAQPTQNLYDLHKGCLVNDIDIQITAGELASIRWGILGLFPTDPIQSTPFFGAAAPVGTEQVLTAIEHVTVDSVGGSPTTANVSTLNFTMTNNLRKRLEIGTLGPFEFGLGDATAEITYRIYFREGAAAEDFVNDHRTWTDSSIAFSLTDPLSGSYQLELPNAKVIAAPYNFDGRNTDVFIDGVMRSKIDANGDSIRITRS